MKKPLKQRVNKELDPPFEITILHNNEQIYINHRYLGGGRFGVKDGKEDAIKAAAKRILDDVERHLYRKTQPQKSNMPYPQNELSS